MWSTAHHKSGESKGGGFALLAFSFVFKVNGIDPGSVVFADANRLNTSDRAADF